jgi:hypothetical protein
LWKGDGDEGEIERVRETEIVREMFMEIGEYLFRCASPIHMPIAL